MRAVLSLTFLHGSRAAPVRSGWLMQEHGFNTWKRDRFVDPPASCTDICAHHGRACSDERLAQAAGMNENFARRFADGVPSSRFSEHSDTDAIPWTRDEYNRRIKEQLRIIGELAATQHR